MHAAQEPVTLNPYAYRLAVEFDPHWMAAQGRAAAAAFVADAGVAPLEAYLP